MEKKDPKIGLSIKEAEQLHIQLGPNTIEEGHKEPLAKKVFEQFKSFLIILLIIAAVLSFVIGEVIDGFLILTLILLNASFGIYQEYKAEQAVAALREMSLSLIRVIRDGTEQEIDSTYLVPGDVFLLEEGVKIPADAVIIESRNLEVNESALTGESIPVIKAGDDELFMGTIVAKGRAQAKVTQIGMNTKFGSIAQKLSMVKEQQTPLQKKLSHLTEVIGVIGILLSFLVFGLSLMQGEATFPSFLLAISLAVAVVPESLPAVMTVILSIGVKHMAQRKAIVRKLGAIEALGSTTLIATDKTGTLTQNKMSVKLIYADETEFTHKQIIETKSHVVADILLNGVLCSTASLVAIHDHGSFDILGDPTEGALLLAAHDKGMNIDFLRQTWTITDELPFNSIKKRMSVLVKKEATVIYTKGAPESILNVSSHIQKGDSILPLNEEARLAIENKLSEWSRQGLRVLAFAKRETDTRSAIFSHLKKVEYEEEGSLSLRKEGLIFLGMAAIYDPPREEAQEAIVRARKAGIDVVMITGDNEKTAESIGTHLGLVREGDVIMTGAQIEEFTDEQLMELLPRTRVFARTTPFHKSRIVSLYQQLGEVVAVTGDGVNDAIALKQADVGVAMGKVGTDVARETSDMIIMDDNFATIVNAVEEGRNIVLRLKKAIQYLLTGNLSEGLTLIVGLSLGFPPILLPIQLLYINLITDGIPALAMALSPHDERVMKESPSHGSTILEKLQYYYIAKVGLGTAIIVMGTYWVVDAGLEMKQTAAFTVLALIQTFVFMDIWFHNGTKKKSLIEYLPPIFLLTVSIPLVLQYIIVSIPFLASVFDIQTLSWNTFLSYLFVSSLVLVLIRIHRLVDRDKR